MINEEIHAHLGLMLSFRCISHDEFKMLKENKDSGTVD